MAIDAVQQLCEGVWGLGFRLMRLGAAAVGRTEPVDAAAHFDAVTLDGGTLDPRAAACRQQQDALRVLAVSAHPDDEMAGCGGALLLHRRAGHRSAIVQVTDGRRSRAFGLDPGEMARRRRREAEAAAEHLGAELHWLGLPEGAWSHDRALAQLVEILERWRPELIYAPSCIDFHREHLRVARALAVALETAALDGWVRCYQVQVPLTAILVNSSLDIDEVGDRLARGLQLYRTQYGSLERCLRMRRYAGRRRGKGLCEEHWQLPTATYVHLHRALRSASDPSSYRSLRYLALTDPLAYLLGRRRRRRLAALASSTSRRDSPAEGVSSKAARP